MLSCKSSIFSQISLLIHRWNFAITTATERSFVSATTTNNGPLEGEYIALSSPFHFTLDCFFLTLYSFYLQAKHFEKFYGSNLNKYVTVVSLLFMVVFLDVCFGEFDLFWHLQLVGRTMFHPMRRSLLLLNATKLNRNRTHLPTGSLQLRLARKVTPLQLPLSWMCCAN